jgi:hypothetical protein
MGWPGPPALSPPPAVINVRSSGSHTVVRGVEQIITNFCPRQTSVDLIATVAGLAMGLLRFIIMPSRHCP